MPFKNLQSVKRHLPVCTKTLAGAFSDESESDNKEPLKKPLVIKKIKLRK